MFLVLQQILIQKECQSVGVIHVQCEKYVNTKTGDVEGEERDDVTNPAPVPKV